MNGVINVLKPPGMTSHDVVSYVRKALKIKKVGHTGTLDPGACGVLPIMIGKATKIAEYFENDKKEYICEMTLGKRTDTLDKYGKTIGSKDFNGVSLKEFNKVLEKYKGEIIQTPPSYSAIKINGKRAYELARNNIDVKLKPRKITIFNMEIIKFEAPCIILKILCSKGTYIRSICDDIGSDLGCYGYMSFLERTKTGIFHIEGSTILSDINTDNAENIIIPSDKVIDFKSIKIESTYKARIINGNPIKINCELNSGELVKIYLESFGFIGIGKIEEQYLKVEKLLI